MVELKMNIDIDISAKEMEHIDKSGTSIAKISIEAIAKETGLSHEEVEKLWDNPERIQFTIGKFKVNVRKQTDYL